jgi:hypothetical protein
MLSGAKHLVFSVTWQDEILRLSPQDDIATRSRWEEAVKVGGISQPQSLKGGDEIKLYGAIDLHVAACSPVFSETTDITLLTSKMFLYKTARLTLN